MQFQKELSNVYCDEVVLKYPPESTHASTTESDLTRFISDNNNVAKEEIVACVCIYSIGTLSIDNEMARRRRAEVKFSRSSFLRMCDVVKTSSSLRRRLNLRRFSVLGKT